MNPKIDLTVTKHEQNTFYKRLMNELDDKPATTWQARDPSNAIECLLMKLKPLLFGDMSCSLTPSENRLFDALGGSMTVKIDGVKATFSRNEDGYVCLAKENVGK